MFMVCKNTNRETFYITLFLCFLVTIFLGLECFGGYKTSEELRDSVEKTIYENLILKDDGQKITLKEFGDVTKDELKKIEKEGNETSQTIEDRIVSNYLFYSSAGVAPESKKVLEKELNKKYKIFIQKASKESSITEKSMSRILKVIYTLVLFFLK